MTITEFKTVLAVNPDKNLRFILPGGKVIPPSFHITEVGNVRKDFIDCGGTVRTTSACVLQAWVAANDEDHRLEAGKLGAILSMADKIIADANLSMELEYEAPIISQFGIVGSKVESDAIVFHLVNKHTDCLAKESCGLEGGGCATSEGDCCGGEETAIPAKGKTSCC